MTYKEAKEQVLKLLNQYTKAGDAISALYNNQQDYLVRIPSFINDAMMEIATTARKIPTSLNLDALPHMDLGEDVRIELPSNFYQFKSGDTVKTDDGRVLHTNQYSLLGKRYIVIPKRELDNVRITYYRYPFLLEENPDDAATLDNAPETHFAVPFYVAAMLVAHDDAFLCSLFMNKYNDKLQNMHSGITAESHATNDAYGFFM